MIRKTGDSVNHEASNKIKRILFWTPYFDWKDFKFGIGQDPFVRAGCRITNCLTTYDRSFLNESDALLFHAINFDPVNDAPLQRMPHQRYVFFSYEAEAPSRSSPVFQHLTVKGFYNWTMTYRRDSDIYSSEPYGLLRRKNTSLMSETMPVPSNSGLLPPDPAKFLQTIINRRNYLEENQLFSDFASRKKKKIAWFVTNCATSSRREIYFRELFYYFPSIDIYGECGNGLSCFPWNGLECDKILSEYRFYIAAENSLCADYVTEKFYRALEAGAVPIVYGGADYSAYAPINSFINAADFRSPKYLAHYLRLLDLNPNLYARYFEWKKDWLVDRRPFDGWCSLCEKLNDPNQLSKSYNNITKWWYDDVPCVLEALKNHP